MKLTKNRLILTGVIFVLFLTSFTQVNGLIDDNSDNKLSVTEVYNEDFLDVLDKDPSTTAWGWGSGTLTNERNFSWELLDFYDTPYQARSVDVQGRKVYVSQFHPSDFAYSIGCYNINDPSNIILMSERGSIPRTLTFVVDGDVGYAGTDFASQNFIHYNVSKPYDFNGLNVYLGGISRDGIVTDIDPEGYLVYYTVYNSASDSSLRVFNSADPSSPIDISASWTSNKALGLEVEGHLAYVAASTDGLYILNVSNKNTFVELGHVDLPGNATDVILDGNIAYVSLGDAGVATIDVSDPTLPELKAIYDTDGISSQMVLQGNTLFVADGPAGVCVLDVASHNHLSYVTDMPLPYTWDVDLYGGVLVVASNDGIRTFQICAGSGITDFSQSYYVNAWTSLQAWDVRVLGDIAYVAGGPDGFYTLNVRDPNNPILLDQVVLPGVYRKLDVKGTFAHVVSDGHYYMFDIQDPSNIVLVCHIFGNQILDVFIQGDLTYITWQLGSYVVLNMSIPDSWYVVDEPMFGTNITALWVQGPHVYTVEDQAGSATQTFRIFQTLDLTNQIQTSAAPGTTGYFYDIKVDGDLAYTSDTNWLVVYNVTDPYNLFFRTDIEIDFDLIDSYGVWTFGPYIMNAAGSDGVYLVNATDLDNCEATRYTDATGALQITTSGDYTYVANKSSLVILRHFESAGDTYVPGSVFAQSTKVSTASDIEITEATLTADFYHHISCSYDFYLSADGGLHWEAVNLNALHIFTYPGDDLRWRVILNGLSDRSDHIYYINIDYDYDIIPAVYEFPEYSYAIILGLSSFMILAVNYVKRRKNY